LASEGDAIFDLGGALARAAAAERGDPERDEGREGRDVGALGFVRDGVRPAGAATTWRV
jgi:hypothetical protein